MKISLCMIAKNEGKVIGRAIDSCKGVVDEIILVDTGSEDRTVEIAKSKGAKVYFFAWKNDFAAAKNYALSKAKGDWIIFLDADEYFGNGTERNLRNLLEKIEKEYDAVAAYMVNIDAYDGRQLDTIVQMRIFKNNGNIRYTSPIHEVLYNFKPGKNIKALMMEEKDLVLFHTGYSIHDKGEKARRNMEILLEEMKKENTPPAYSLYLSDCYFALEEWEKVIETAREFLKTGTDMLAYKTKPYRNIIEAMGKLNYPKDEIMAEIELGIAKFPTHPQFQFYMATFQLEKRRYDSALVYLKKALEFHENYCEVEANSLGVNLWFLYHEMGVNYEMRGDLEKAIYYYQLSLQKDWKNESCCSRLMQVLRGRPLSEVTSILNSIFNIENEECLNFLLKQLVNTATPEVLAHYVIIRQKKYPKSDFILLQMLLANKYYSKAVPALVECVRKDGDSTLAIVTAAAFMLSEDETYQDGISFLPVTLQKIIKAFRGQSTGLEEVSPQILVELVHIFLLWGKPSQMSKILSLRQYFTPELTIELGYLLVERGHFQTAVELYHKLIFEHVVGGFVYYNLAYCFHQLGKSKEAVDCLIQAFDKGYRENDLYEVLRWSAEKIVLETPLKEKVDTILMSIESL